MFGAVAAAQAKARHSHRYLVAQGLARALRGYPLGRYAFQLEASGHRWNINPYLIAGIAKLESTLGLAACGPDLWGYNSCSYRPWGSVEEGIEYVTRRIRTVYIAQWGHLTASSIGIKWCTCGDRYGWYLLQAMRNLGGTTEAVYP